MMALYLLRSSPLSSSRHRVTSHQRQSVTKSFLHPAQYKGCRWLYCWVNGSPAKTPSGPRVCGPMSPGWHSTWHWHWPAHSNHPDLSWGSLIQAPASTHHHPLNFLVSQYPATQLTVMLLDTNFLRQWMVDVFVIGMMSSPPSCRFYRSSEAASRPHLLPAQHSHTTNQKFSAYPGLLPLSTQLSACSLQ